jgi:hypothetical protein
MGTRASFTRPVERPVVGILASSTDARTLHDLFARRGFSVLMLAGAADLRAAAGRAQPLPSAVVIDLHHAEACPVVQVAVASVPPPALVGVACDGSPYVAGYDILDRLLLTPVDPAVLFVQVVEVVAVRRTGRRRRKLSGIVGAVSGNDLFVMVANQLTVAVPAVNASAVLEAALRALGTGPFILKEADLVASIHSGRLAEALEPFGSPALIKLALKRVLALVTSNVPLPVVDSSAANTLPIARIRRPSTP